MDREELAKSIRTICEAIKQTLSASTDEAFEASFMQLKETVFRCWPEEGVQV